jgi:rfaE bifunctional protein kinase chain/domain/rfaE bifunctional protein nucleotidyltransferase chain/domain
MVQSNLSKIKSLDELAEIISTSKAGGKKVVLCHGVFDLLHPGHIRHFSAARKLGDILVVTLTQDRYVGKGPGRPVFNENLRAESIAALECVTYVAINEWPVAVETIKRLKPSLYVKGSDYANADDDLTGKIRDEKEAIESVGGKLVYTDEITFSSSKLINQNLDVFSKETREYLNNIKARYTAPEIIRRLHSLRKLKVLLVGDTIIDEYCYCQPLGKSAKENLIPVQYLHEETSAGGIMAVANHVSGFCDKVDVVTCLGGKNDYHDFILKSIRNNISAKFMVRADSPTTVKRRFVEADFFRKLFEVNYLNGQASSEKVSQETCQYLQDCVGDYDLVIVADYGHGFIDRPIIDVLCEKAKLLAINVQTNAANYGFNLVTKYPRADFISLNEPELRLATRDNLGQLEELALKIAEQLHSSRLMVTRGHRGALYYGKDKQFYAAPAFSKEIIDRMGAGDALLSVASLCAAGGFPPDLVAFLGNAAGALAIRIVGNTSSVEPVMLYKYINTLLS